MEIFKKPWWVRTLNSSMYEIDAASYKRFDERKVIVMQVAREKSFSEEDLENAIWRTIFGDRPLVRSQKAGWSLLERALQMGANTVRNSAAGKVLYSWQRVQARTPTEMGLDPYRGTAENNSRVVKRAALFYGASDAGIASLEQKFFYAYDYKGRPILFEDVAEAVKSEEKIVIPEKCTNVIVLAVPQSRRAIAQAPDFISSAATSLSYSQMPMLAASLSEFIRSLGYTAIPCGNDTALSVPIAIDAGLGEQSRTNLLIHPIFGLNLRLVKVITDMPLVTDSPIEFGAREFCMVCRKCAQKCPSGAISFGPPSFENKGNFNNYGYKGWFLDSPKCLEQWQKFSTGCAICVRVCPFTKQDTALHRIVRALISRTSVFNRFLIWADDAGGFSERQKAERWWE